MKIRVEFYSQDSDGMKFKEVHPFGKRPEPNEDPFFNIGMAERQDKWDQMDRQLKIYKMKSRQETGLQIMDGPFFKGNFYYAEVIDEETIEHPLE